MSARLSLRSPRLARLASAPAPRCRPGCACRPPAALWPQGCTVVGEAPAGQPEALRHAGSRARGKGPRHDRRRAPCFELVQGRLFCDDRKKLGHRDGTKKIASTEDAGKRQRTKTHAWYVRTERLCRIRASCRSARNRAQAHLRLKVLTGQILPGEQLLHRLEIDTMHALLPPLRHMQTGEEQRREVIERMSSVGPSNCNFARGPWKTPSTRRNGSSKAETDAFDIPKSHRPLELVADAQKLLPRERYASLRRHRACVGNKPSSLPLITLLGNWAKKILACCDHHRFQSRRRRVCGASRSHARAWYGQSFMGSPEDEKTRRRAEIPSDFVGGHFLFSALAEAGRPRVVLILYNPRMGGHWVRSR